MYSVADIVDMVDFLVRNTYIKASGSIFRHSLVNLRNHPAKLGESIKFGILVHFHLFFTILRVPESSNETGPLIWSLKRP